MTRKRALGLDAKRASFKAQTKQRKSNGNKIRRMLAAMEAQTNHNQQNQNQASGHGQPDRDGSSASATKANPENEQFFSTGRTGRRNALPDILGDHAHVTSSDLPARLQALTTSETNKLNPEDQPGPSRHTPEQN